MAESPESAAAGIRFRPTVPLVGAKLHPPVLRRGTIDRPRLLEPLLDAAGPRVVAVFAPPGYGKTTLLAQFAAREPRPVAWLTVDELDNDPATLTSYLVAAFDRIHPIPDSIRSGIAAPPERILATAVPRLASELARWRRPVVLILDDVHRLTDRISLDVLGLLVDHFPSGCRVVISGRVEPDLPVARMRADGILLDIDTRRLALTDAETGALAAEEGFPLAPDAARSLAARTEGWAAGIHLAALAQARGLTGATSLVDVSGQDHYIAAYFRSEFEREQSPIDVEVLSRVAVLEAITPGPTEAVGGRPDAWRRLEAIASRSLLISGIAGAEPTYRIHGLLRDFLLDELERHEPGASLQLHRRAASWYAANGDMERAVNHALASADRDMAARLVTMAGLRMFFGGRPATLIRWMGDLDAADFERFPPLAVLAAWMCTLTGRAEEADRMADLADRLTFEGDPGDGSASFESIRATLRASMVRRGVARMLEDARVATSAEGPDSPWLGTALGLEAMALLMLGRTDEAESWFRGAAAAGNMVSIAMLGRIATMRGDWPTAEAHAAQAMTRLQVTHFGELAQAAIVFAVNARVEANRGDAERAREHLVRAQRVRPLLSYAAPWLAVYALVDLARAYLGIADPAGAQLALREAEHVVRRRPDLGTLTSELLAVRRQLATAVDSLAGASALTSAELRLLPFLATYLSFQEIADRFNVSRSTVKTQAMAVYGKLQATSRSEAVERAVELGLLEPLPNLTTRDPRTN